MCGFAGFLAPGGFASDDATAAVRRMTDRIAHRGPDAAGAWTDDRLGVALGHRRLSILDLTEAGAQPMASPSGRWVLAYNGEAYDHERLRDAYRPGPDGWRGTSDTESLVTAFDGADVATVLQDVTGMFAFAAWDRERRVLVLARDRLGEKPLYYGWQGGRFLFGSELGALRAHPAFENRVDRSALAAYLRYGYVPAPHAIYDGIWKVPPGHLLRFPLDTAPGVLPDTEAYWSLSDVARAGRDAPFTGSAHDAADELESLLGRSVRGQLLSDVPLGAFLSGGVDSSLIVALMRAHASEPVRTFTIGFEEPEFDESDAARTVAEHLGTEHRELIVTPREAMDVIPQLPEIYDEPFGDVSAVPTWLVSRLAREQVTVALSGDGGDELFAGYARYRRTERFWSRTRRLPAPVRRAAAATLRACPSEWAQRAATRAGIGSQPYLLAGRVEGVASILDSESIDGPYRLRMARFSDPGRYLACPVEVPSLWAEGEATDRDDPTERMMAFDTRSYLPDDVLVKVDRAAMAHGLETRVPLLDPRVVAFAWSLPRALRGTHGAGKELLRKVLHRHVPADLVDRPKSGFGVPIGAWLRDPLRPWAEDLLAPSAEGRIGPFREGPIRDLWSQHLSGRADWSHLLWPVLAYLAWAEHTGATLD